MKKKVTNVVKSLLLPVIVYIVLTISTGGRFGKPAAMLLVLRQSVVPLLLAMACAFVMPLGMWDFSAGAVMMTSAILCGAVSIKTGMGIPAMVVTGILTGLVLSMVTGLLYNVMKVPSMVLTVGLAMVYEAIPRLFSADFIQIKIRDNTLARVPWCFVVLAVFFAIFYVVTNRTAYGKNVRAIGANQVIANNAGVDLQKTKFISFALSGLFCGVAGVLFMSNSITLQAPVAFGSVGQIFDAMMGIFIAFFLERYCNFAFGIVIGTLSMKMLTSGLIALGLSTTVRDITTGAFLLVLLIFSSNQSLLDQIRNRRAVRKRALERA